jgi:hypothetical protein
MRGKKSLSKRRLSVSLDYNIGREQSHVIWVCFTLGAGSDLAKRQSIENIGQI